MIFFGHLGIPLSVLQIYEEKVCKSKNEFLEHIDYRVFLIGTILPDLIDKPIYLYFHRSIGTSQSFGHTLIFLISMLLTGLILYKRHKKPFLITLAIGVFAHQGLDFVTMNYENFLWPLFGFRFISGRFYETTIFEKFTRDISSPYYLFGELIGFPITAYYFIRLFKEKKFINFIMRGRPEA